MVAPVVGPTNTEVGGTGVVDFYRSQMKYRQSKPYDLVLPYHSVASKGSRSGPETNVHARTAIAGMTGTAFISAIGTWYPWAPLVGGCYDKLKDKISDRASMGVTLAEIGQSLSMIELRALQIAKFAREVRTLRFGDAARTLKMAFTPHGVSVHKSFANNFLEYWFGWSPLIGDIYSAIDVLQSPFNDVYVKASISGGIRLYPKITEIHTFNPNAWYPSYTEYWNYHYLKGRQQVKMGAEIEVTNPNLWLANQLGLVNPLVVAYELIPFSFVANWFANVEQFLSSGTDFYGLTLKRTWTNYKFTGEVHYLKKALYRWLEGSPSRTVYGGGVFGKYDGTVVALQRVAGLVQPSFYVRPWKPWKWQRTASAVSLLVQRL